MFTPQRKGWFPSPRLTGGAPDDVSVLSRSNSKGKRVAADETPPPPPQASLDQNGGVGAVSRSEMDDWKSFRDAGFLDRANLQRRDRESLVERISELEKELHDYQYNMGLLLIEKQEWLSKYEEMREGLAESKEILKREQAAHFIAVSELEKREENMRKALGVEKQCVSDLEKALRGMHAEMAEKKLTSDKKLAEAYALETSIEEKFLEVEGKLHSADAKLAEATRKSLEIGRKLEVLESREHRLQRDVSSLNAERKMHEKEVAEQREHLRDWEKKLQEGQKRLVDGQKFLNEREDKANETEVNLKKKEEEIEEAQRVIEAGKILFKEQSDDLKARMRALTLQEKEAEKIKENLMKKEKELVAREGKLNARERVEIPKLVDHHNAILDAKKQEFEMEMEKKRKSFDEELKHQLEEVEKVKLSVENKEENIAKREQALESNMKELKIKEKDLVAKSKALKKWEESLKSSEKKLHEEKQQLGKDMQELVISKHGLESLKAAIQAEKQQITVEKEILRITKEERDQHLSLQSRLKQEIEEYRRLKESLIREGESLRQEKEKFEREWEALDEKRMTLETEVKHLNDERNRLERLRQSEEEMLKKEALETRLNIQSELDNLRLKKEAFESEMDHERSEAREEVKREHADIARELELRRHELEMSMQKKQEDMEKKLQERENEFVRRRENELNQIKSTRNSNESNYRKLKMEQDRLEREKEEIRIYSNKLESDQLEIQKDIDTLRMLSRNLKAQRENFVKDKEFFLSLTEKCKVCKSCGVPISELWNQPTREIEDAGDALLPSPGDEYLAEHVDGGNIGISPRYAGSQSFSSGGSMSWLKKCSKMFNFTPGKSADHSVEVQADKPVSFGAGFDRVDLDAEADYRSESFDTQRSRYDSEAKENAESERFDKTGDEPGPSFGITDNLIDIPRINSKIDISEGDIMSTIPSIDEQNEKTGDEPGLSFGITDNLIDMPKINSKIDISEGDIVSTIPSIDEQNETEIGTGSQPQPSTRRRQPSRRGRPKTIKRTHSVLEVVQDAKAFLGETFEVKDNGQPGDDATKDSLNVHGDSPGDPVNINPVATSARQKRHLPRTDDVATSDVDAENSEARSESVSLGGRRKRRQITVPGMQTPGEKRYNLRRSTIASTVAAAQAMSDQAKGVKAGTQIPSPNYEKFDDVADGEGTSKHDEFEKTADMKTNTESVAEVQENSSEKLIRFEIEETRVECDANIVVKPVEFSDRSREDGDEVDGVEAATPPKTPSDSEKDDEQDVTCGDEDDESHDASIGKKIWTFFTT